MSGCQETTEEKRLIRTRGQGGFLEEMALELSNRRRKTLQNTDAERERQARILTGQAELKEQYLGIEVGVRGLGKSLWKEV